MSKFKIEFQKPKLTLCNTNYTPLGILTNKTHMSAYNITLTSKVNETPSLSFDIPLGGLIDNNSTELLIKHKNDYFVIKNISVTSGDISSVTVNAEHIACELKGIVVSYFEDLIGESPENMWNTVITNCSMPEVIRSRYIFETNIVDTYRYLSGEDEKSIYEHLVDIAKQFEACLLFSTDADGKIHIKLLYGDIDRGKFIRKGKDLKQLNLNFSTDSLFTKVTPFGATGDDGIELTIMDVNNGKSYITNYDYYLAKGMTAEEIRNNPLCNQECVYRNADIVDAEDLLRLGRQELDKLSKPIVNGTIEAIDLNVFEGSLYLSPILCEKIIVIDKDINYSISCKITEIEFTYDNPLESKIGISNVVKYSTVLKDLVQNSEAISEILTNGLNGRPNLNASKVKGLIDGHIAQLKYSMENSITDVTDAVILFEDRIEGDSMYGALAIGSRGILISREVDPITNQWVWTTALDAHGLSTQVVNALEINASQIKGDILSSYDNSTWINLNNGEFNFKDKIKFVDNEFRIALNSGGTIEDFVTQYEKDKQNMTNDINDVAQEVTNIKSNIDVVISDGIVTEAEVASIEKSIMQLQKEKVDIDTRYTSMVNNSYLDSELKSELTSSYNNYTKAHKNFVDFIRNIITDRKITEGERADLDTYSSSYNTTLATLKTNMDTCLSNIAENNTAYQINNLKTQIDSDFKDVNDRLNTIMDDVGGAVADGIIEEAEILIIQNSINQLNKEKEDVDMIYNTLYNNNDVPTDIKRNLKTKYDEYVAIHRNLITFINNMVSDKVATEQEKANFNNLSSSYSTKLAEFKNAANIALVMANKNYTDTQFNVLDGKIEMRVTSTEVNELVNSNLEESKAYSDTLFQECQNQIDGVVETYYQSTDPSLDWTTAELKAKHIGDIWYNTLDKSTYIYAETSISSDGTMGTAWQKLTDAEAEQAYALASSKAKVFTSTPTTPYKKGDLWVQGSSGDIMKCIYARTSGNFSSSDWAKASKYTDDTKANQVASDLANNYYTITQTNSAIEVAKESIELGVTKEVEVIYDDIGGKNLIRNSAFVNGTICWSFAQNVSLDTSRTFNGHASVKSSQSGLTYDQWRGCTNAHLPITNPLTVNQTYTLSCYYYIENTNTFDSNLGLEVKGVKVGATAQSHICSIGIPKSNLVSNKWTRVVGTFTLTEEYSSTFVYAWVGRNGTAWFTEFKLEKGNKCTDWTAAPEDSEDYTEAKIKIASDSITNTVSNTYVNKSTLNNYPTTTQMNSAITQKANSITSSVSNTYATKNSLGNLESRVNSAEQSITSDAIINKVNTAIGNGKSISTTSTTLNKNGFTVYNGAIYIKNKNGENVLWGDTNGNLQAKGKITTINNNGYLNLEGNKLQGYKSGMSVPMYSCGMWYPNNGSKLSGFVSVSNGNSLIGDSEGCLYMSGWNDSSNANKKAVLQYSRNEGSSTGTVEFYNNGGVSVVSRNTGGNSYGIWNSQEGYVYPYRGDEYFGASNRPWTRAYIREMYQGSVSYFSAPSSNYLLTNVNDDEIETYAVDNKPKPKDFVEFVENLEFGIYKKGEDNEEEIQTFAEKETNLNFMPIVDDISTFALDENPAKSLVIQTVTDRNGENPQQAINLMGYCTTLAITIQELIKENKELKNEIIEIKNRLNNIEK